MASWLIFTDIDNWEIIKKENVWGVSPKFKNTIAKVNVGDDILVYVKKTTNDVTDNSKILAHYKASSKMYLDDSIMFKSKTDYETYPYRINIKPIKTFIQPIVFKDLVAKLNFITNKQSWGLHIFGRAMKEIPESDFKLNPSIN